MARDGLTRIKVFGDERRRHHQCLPRIHETFARRSIDGKFFGGVERGDSREVADGVSVFGVGQPPQDHGARIARPLTRQSPQGAINPARESANFFHARLRLIRRRHLSVLQLLRYLLPNQRVPPDVPHRNKALQVQFTLLLRGRVTGKAIGF